MFCLHYDGGVDSGVWSAGSVGGERVSRRGFGTDCSFGLPVCGLFWVFLIYVIVRRWKIDEKAMLT